MQCRKVIGSHLGLGEISIATNGLDVLGRKFVLVLKCRNSFVLEIISSLSKLEIVLIVLKLSKSLTTVRKEIKTSI